MTASIQTIYVYQNSDFPQNKVQPEALATEITAAGTLSVPVASVSALPGGASIALTGLAVAADTTALNAIVAAHTAPNFSATLQKASNNSVVSDDSGSVIDHATTLSTGPLPAGEYAFTVALEYALTNNPTGNQKAQVTWGWTKNGGSFNTGYQAVNATNDWELFAVQVPQTVKAGESFVFKVQYQRLGSTAGNPARVRRLILGCQKIQ